MSVTRPPRPVRLAAAACRQPVRRGDEAPAASAQRAGEGPPDRRRRHVGGWDGRGGGGRRFRHGGAVGGGGTSTGRGGRQWGVTGSCREGIAARRGAGVGAASQEAATGRAEARCAGSTVGCRPTGWA